MDEERRVMYSGQPVVSPVQNQDAYRRALMVMADGERNPNAARKFTRGTSPLARKYYSLRRPLRMEQEGLISAIANYNFGDGNEDNLLLAQRRNDQALRENELRRKAVAGTFLRRREPGGY